MIRQNMKYLNLMILRKILGNRTLKSRISRLTILTYPKGNTVYESNLKLSLIFLILIKFDMYNIKTI